MGNSNSMAGSGDGTRPTTDGGVDNIGGAGGLYARQRVCGLAAAPRKDDGETKGQGLREARRLGPLGADRIHRQRAEHRAAVVESRP